MTTIKDALNDLLINHDLPLAETVDRHFSPTYRQRTNGSWDDRDRFIAHIAHLRDIVERATITVLEELAAGHLYAERHIVDLIKHDGTQVVQEVYVFRDRNPDGRFTRIEETTLTLEGSEADRSLANAR